jgi:FkbM family methyltransferase
MKASFSFFEAITDLPLLSVVDVGAMPIDGYAEIYRSLVDARRAALTAFEPDATAFAALSKSLRPPHQCFPYFIGDGQPGTFHVNNAPMTSSLYPPNTELLALFPNVAQYVQPVSRHAVQTRRLDDIAEILRIDFLKLDVQGAALDVLRGCTNKLAETLVVHTEVEFVPLYRGQPLFADVDTFLRAQGFQFHTFAGLAKRYFAPLSSPPDQPSGVNQILWADAVYIRDPLSWPHLAPERRLMLAALMHDLYGSVDVALTLVKSVAEAGWPINYSGYVQRLQASAVR